MSDIRIERNHSFDFDTARTQAKKWLETAKTELGLDIEYQEGANSDTAKISKSGVEAVATLDAQKIVFEANLNFLAKPFKGVISSGINEGLQKYFG